MVMQAPHVAKIQPVRRGEKQTTGDTDEHFEKLVPITVSPDGSSRQYDDPDHAEQYDPYLPVHSVAERKSKDAGRYDQPQHQAMKMRIAAERESSYRQHGHEYRHGQTVDDA